MVSNLYESFLTATRDVFQLMLDLSEINDCPVNTSDFEGESLTISIGIVGDLIGAVMYRFPRETSLKIVNILSGMELDSVDDFVTSAIAEIANIISGNVMTLMEKENIKCDILPPVPNAPEDDGEYSLRTARCVCTSIGNVCMDIHLNSTR